MLRSMSANSDGDSSLSFDAVREVLQYIILRHDAGSYI